MNVGTMPAGREMDALIAEKVMGHKVVKLEHAGYYEEHPLTKDGFVSYPLCLYSTEMADAWKVVEKLWETPLVVVIGGYISAGMGNVPWVCEIGNGITEPSEYAKKWIGQAETAPLAVCRAALKAVVA